MNDMDVDLERYTHAVNELLVLAQGDALGSRAAAQVVLSAYNGREFQLDVTDLGNLDQHYRGLAVTVIIGRNSLQVGPEEVTVDGKESLDEISRRWERLRVTNRWKPDCLTCYGQGKVEKYPDDWNNDELTECPDCSGRGW